MVGILDVRNGKSDGPIRIQWGIFSRFRLVLAMPGQETEALEDEGVARVNPESGNIEILEILFFSKRVEPPLLKLAILAMLQPAT